MNKQKIIDCIANFLAPIIKSKLRRQEMYKVIYRDSEDDKVDEFVYCPWCGKKLDERKPLKQ